jgi:ABC-type Mn2+/Zn2+ transport system permease subunit
MDPRPFPLGGYLMRFGELWTTGVLRRATFEAILIGALGGVVGVHVILRRLPFFTTAVAHASFPGVVLADMAGLDPIIGALAFAWLVAAAVVLSETAPSGEQRGVLDDSSVVGVCLAGALGLGVILQSLQARPPRNLASVLTGSVLGVSAGQLIATAAIAVAVLTILALFHKEFVLGGFDPLGARAQGYRRRLDVTVLGLIALTAVTTVPAVGTVLSVSALVAPPLAARCWVDRVGATMIVAGGIGAVSGFVGMVVSLNAEVAAGPSITLTASAALAFSWVFGPYGGAISRRSVAH